MPSRALVTFGNGAMAPILELGLRTLAPYAERWGYELVVAEPDSRGRPTSWAKVPLLLELLARHDEVLWVDADVTILDAGEDLAAHVPAGAFQALSETRVADLRHPNCGVWLLRPGLRTTAFLEAVWACEHFAEHRWWENAAVMDLLGYDLDPGRGPVAASPWRAGTRTCSRRSGTRS